MAVDKTLLREAQNNRVLMSEVRRFLHAHAETGFDLSETVARVRAELEAMGYAPQDCGKAGLVATVGGKKPGKVFMLRADMDALPITEESGVDFACTAGRMHACGHDMHTAMLLGAAKLLKDHEDEIEGTVKLMFQPAEEIFAGSHDMIEAGLLKNPDVDAAMMIHVMAGMPFPVGTVIVSSPGVSAPAADYFTVTVQGKGCHGAMPNTGIDPLTAAAHILIGLQEIHARELAIGDRAVMTVGMLHAGTAPNIIPDTAELSGSIRTFDEETRGYIKERICQIAGGIAGAFRATAEVSFGNGCPTLLNNEELSVSAVKYMKELLGEGMVFTSGGLSKASGGKGASKTAGSEDFAYVSQEVPSIMMALAAGQPNKGYAYPQHHPMVKFDEDALAGGSAVYAYMAMRWLEDHAE